MSQPNATDTSGAPVGAPQNGGGAELDVLSPRSSITSDSSITDEDSDTRSIHSRRDSLESTVGGRVQRQEKIEVAGGISADTGGTRRAGASAGGGNSGGESARQKRNISAAAGEDSNGGEQATAMLRKACDLCTKRKRKCNGQHPCSQCIETGVRHQCIYSPRLKSGRKKKVRIDGALDEEGAGLIPENASGQALVSNNRRSSAYTVDTQAGRFSASGAVGLAGHVENFFLATYLRDFNRIVPLTTESSVMEGMLEVLSPAVSSRGLSQTSPIPQPESRRQAKLAVFWGVVSMGSRILKAEDEATARYLSLMRAALRECFDSNDKEVVQAYLLLSTVESMRGNEEAGKRYLDHAHTMHNGNAVGSDGQLLQGRQEQEESLDLVFQVYGQPDGCVGYMANHSHGRPRRLFGVDGTLVVGDGSASANAVDRMIAQAMSPPSESQSGPLKALKFLSTACGLSSEVFDPTNKCVTVKQYIAEMDAALKGADTLFKHTDLSECITGVVMVKIWGGVTVLMQSWGKEQEKEIGLAQVEEGVGYALTRPGLMTFSFWWHALHSAAIVLAHFGHNDTYMRLRATFNKNTFRGTEMPSIETYSPGAICPQLGGSCSKLAYWLQVRGTMCSASGWKPQFDDSKLTEESENAAYAAALSRKFSSNHGGVQNPNGETYQDVTKTMAISGISTIVGSGPLQREQSSEAALMRAALMTGLNEPGAGRSDLGDVDGLANADVEDLDSLGAEFDLSQFKDFEAESDEPPQNSRERVEMMGFSAGFGDDLTLAPSGGWEMSREPSFSISGGEATSAGQDGASMMVGESLSHQSSLDIYTIMQMASSDEELKQIKGESEDVMDAALAFGDGPAKELFGVELSAL